MLPPANPRLRILSVPVDDITYANTLAVIAEMVTRQQPHQICTVNPEFVMLAQQNAKFLAVLQQADLNLPDGVGLLWAARLRGYRLRERVAGSTLVDEIAKLAAAQGWGLYLLGAGPGVAAKAAAVLQTRYPSLKVVGCDPADPTPTDAPGIVARVRAAQPQVLMVAYGAPKQDFWIAEHGAECGVPVMIGVGGSLDFIAGVAVRAPRWVQRIGLEWLHRLLKEPWRWRRMLALPRFAWAVLWRTDAVQAEK